MELWIPITIAAALFQNVRTALQKHLRARLDTTGATYVRFLYAAPFTWLYLLLLSHSGLADIGNGIGGGIGSDGQVQNGLIPDANFRFLFFCVVGGTAQILATALLVWLFGQRNFAVGTSLTKTEAVQAAIFGIVILGDALSFQALSGILVSLVGVLALSGKSAINNKASNNITLAAFLQNKTVLPGVAAGALFALSSVAYRAASLALGGEGFLLQSAYTLVWVTGFQTLSMGLYILVRKPEILRRVLQHWKAAIWVGLTGMLGSAGWFAAMTLENAAHVRTLGQIELIFTLMIGYLFFQERLSRRELAGVILVSCGILILLWP
ncbi:DMT family transporter [Kiloniella laminariae]|uniref:DMT family transporter n=1 Tax=Kiloniella laminariae TaxID=454162 RepID=A0ABT4LPB2_9PROT|nr:DMT family transporter [Kiloniella laminariae]MCZ4282876.1 DMT family transporter [Kiloniella laminariae]